MTKVRFFIHKAAVAAKKKRLPTSRDKKMGLVYARARGGTHAYRRHRGYMVYIKF